MRLNALSLSVRTAAATAALACAFITLPAHAFSDDEARTAILQLRQQLQQMKDQDTQARLQLADQIQEMSQQMAQLRDQLELVSRKQPSSAAPAGGPPGSPTPNNPNGAVAGDPQEQAAYDNAIDLFRTGKYKDAADSLSGFVSLYPSSQLAASAQFYLGSSRYALRDFRGAIQEMQVMVQKSPDNARAPDALLVIAGSQIEMNNRAGAKTTLQRIVQNYPSTPAAKTAKDRLQLLQ